MAGWTCHNQSCMMQRFRRLGRMLAPRTAERTTRPSPSGGDPGPDHADSRGSGRPRLLSIATVLVFFGLMAFAVVTAVRSDAEIADHVTHMSSQQRVIDLRSTTAAQADLVSSYEADPALAKAAFRESDFEARQLLENMNAGHSGEAHAGSEAGLALAYDAHADAIQRFFAAADSGQAGRAGGED